MSQHRNRLLVFLAIFIVGVVLTQLFNEYLLGPHVNIEVRGNETLTTIAYCDLVNYQDRFNGKLVRVEAAFYMERHGPFLADSKCRGNGDLNITAIIIGEEDWDGFEQRIDDIAWANGWYSGNIKMVVVGRFKKEEPGQPSDDPRFRIVSDSMRDRTWLHLELVEIERGILVAPNP